MNLDRKKMTVIAGSVGGVLLIALLGWILVSRTVPGSSVDGARQAVQDRSKEVGAPETGTASDDAAADAAARKSVSTRTEAKQALSELDSAVDSVGTGTGE
ncbi:MAG: hypothetical protein HGA38_05090 [Candidatus Moranbacteria bacterium]|nr:hypothetical protein [Candidatus Moranbacteria bacterium]NTW45880.1 hypothetical protein [Candidatus Moranbacteria bacterium]